MILTNDQNKKIYEAVGIRIHKLRPETMISASIVDTFKCTCGWVGKNLESHARKNVLPDFSTPEGQKVLAGALKKKDNLLIHKAFIFWFIEEYAHDMDWLTIIAKNLLAELFLNFLEYREGK